MPTDPAEPSGHSAHLRYSGSAGPRGYSGYYSTRAALAPARVKFAVRPGRYRSVAELRDCDESRDLLLNEAGGDNEPCGFGGAHGECGNSGYSSYRGHSGDTGHSGSLGSAASDPTAGPSWFGITTRPIRAGRGAICRREAAPDWTGCRSALACGAGEGRGPQRIGPSMVTKPRQDGRTGPFGAQ